MEREKKSLSRRGFLKGAAIGAGALAVGDLALQNAQAAPIPKKWDMEADVIVAGYGGAGASAAIEAAKAGASVLLFDKAPVPGGATRLSGGFIYGANTKTQKEAGIQDSADAMVKFVMACGQGRATQELVKAVADMSAENLDWLESMGAKFSTKHLYMSGLEALPEYAAVTPAVKRGHRAEGGGGGLFNALENGVKAQKNIKVILGASVTRPITRPTDTPSSCEVIGVKVLRKGKEINVKAKKAVILSTGGIVPVPTVVPWLKDYAPDCSQTVPAGDLNATGDGYKIGIYCGGALKGLNSGLYLPSIMIADQKVAGMVYGTLWGLPLIYVSPEGKRFVDEGSGYVLTSEVMFQKKITSCYCVFDAEAVKKAFALSKKGVSLGTTIVVGIDPNNLDEHAQRGDIWKADTIAELARKMKIDPATLEKTLADYNQNAEAKKDPDYNRKKGLAPVKTAPYYGFNVRIGMVAHDGGLSINPKAQVLNTYNDVIPRLYAAGRDSIGLFGGRYPASGNAIADCVAFGRIAGRSAATEKAWK